MSESIKYVDSQVILSTFISKPWTNFIKVVCVHIPRASRFPGARLTGMAVALFSMKIFKRSLTSISTVLILDGLTSKTLEDAP